jgi:undecaprenyl-diphosphatase
VALALLVLLVIGIKVFLDVIIEDSGPINTAVLWFIRQHIPRALTDFFSLVTATGAGLFLVPITILLTAMFLAFNHRREALLLASAMACAGISIYAIKALVNRSRPDLWGAAWYSSSSFPSGHTLCTTVLATALVLCVARVWPAMRYSAVALAALWVVLVALSRLVLGAHWPSDVLAAAVLGVFIPLAISTLLDRHAQRWFTQI